MIQNDYKPVKLTFSTNEPATPIKEVSALKVPLNAYTASLPSTITCVVVVK